MREISEETITSLKWVIAPLSEEMLSAEKQSYILKMGNGASYMMCHHGKSDVYEFLFERAIKEIF